MRILVIALLATLGLTTAFTCSKSTPEPTVEQQTPPPPPAQDQMGAPADGTATPPAETATPPAEGTNQ